jgi:hypothetical protein
LFRVIILVWTPSASPQIAKDHDLQPLNDFLSRAIEGMRFRSLALVLLGLIACAIETRADDNSDSNSSNNPVAPKLTLEYWNYYATSLNQLNGDAENGEGRVLIFTSTRRSSQRRPRQADRVPAWAPRKSIISLSPRKTSACPKKSHSASDLSSRSRQRPAPI